MSALFLIAAIAFFVMLWAWLGQSLADDLKD